MKAVILTALTIPFFFLRLHSQTSDQLIDSAFKCIDEKNYGKAINIYTGILAADSLNARVYELRGLAYEEMQDYESSVRDYSYSVKCDPRYWLGYLRRADLFARLEYFDYALHDYGSALLYSDSADQKETILVNRAEVKRKMRNVQGAVEDFEKVLEFNPSSIGALVNLGPLYRELGKSQEAIACLEKVIQLDPTFEGGYGNLAFLYSELGNYQKALEISNKLLSFKPNEAYALNNRGFIKYKLGDLEGALEDINNSIHFAPENSYAFKNRGLVYISLKKNKEACIDFHKALKLGFTKYYGNEVEELIKKHCTDDADTTRMQ